MLSVITASQPDKPIPVEKKYNNNIREIRSIRGLERANLDFESPRLKQAMDDLGVSKEECYKK